MADEKYTSCPSCRTVFRVTQQQLELRSGRVRCGHCQRVFDGVAQLVVLAPRPEPDEDFEEFDELALGPPTVTLRSAHALGTPAEGPLGGEPAASPAPVTEFAEPSAPGNDSAASRGAVGEPVEPVVHGGEAAEASATAGEAAAPSVARDESASAPGRSAGAEARVPNAGRDRPNMAPDAYAVAAPLLALLLAGQAALHFRDQVAARFPAAKPALARLCGFAGCTVGAPQEIENLAIVSDLQADPAHQGLLILTASVRNRGTMPLAYPYLELVLTDTQDQIVVRRVFAPREFMGGTADLASGIPANSEVGFKLFIDASATTQAGYRVYLFYA